MLLDMIPNFATDFNPRLREGGDQNDPVQNEDSPYFNPRLREGGDDFFGKDITPHVISIHASTKEATQETGDFRPFDWIFQSTPP